MALSSILIYLFQGKKFMNRTYDRIYEISTVLVAIDLLLRDISLSLSAFFIYTNSRDHCDYFDEQQTQDTRDEQAFPIVSGDTFYHYAKIKQLPIRPLTRVQGDTAWFIMRKYSLTSSTVDKMISARAGEITNGHHLRSVYETVLGPLKRTNLLPRVVQEEAIVENDTQDGDAEEDVPEEVEDRTDFFAHNWVRRVNNGEHDLFILTLEGNLGEEVIRRIVSLHVNSKPRQPIQTLRKQLKAWALCDHKLKRTYHWYTLGQLVSRVKEIDPRANTSLRKHLLLDLLVNKEITQANQAAAIAAGEDPFSDTIDNVLLQVFKASFMKPLKHEAKKYCRKGHALEHPFLRQFFEHSRRGFTGRFNALAIHDTPLVQSTCNGLPAGALDSSDAELVYSIRGDDEQSFAMPIEIKARVAATTFFAERHQLESNLGLAAFESRLDPTYVELDAETDDVWKWIPKHKESFQLLHHVAIRDLRRGLILVGNTTKIMFGVFVNYSDELVQAYQAILRDLFDRALAIFYAAEDDLCLPQDKILRIIESKAMKPLKLSFHSFATDYFIWRRLRLEQDLKLPLPPCNRILPYNHSFWNNLKGASDTATKLFWNCQVKFASFGKSQTICIGRFLQLYAVCIHRQNHVATAKDDLNKYGSLVHFRNSRNRHWPFYKTVDMISKWFIAQADKADCGNTRDDNPPVEIPLCTTPQRTKRDNPPRAFEEDRTYTTVCGATPGRGNPKFPRNKTANWQKDQDRFHNCAGNHYRIAAGKPSLCYLCGTKTSHVCVGCKRYFCNVNRYQKIHRLIIENKPVVGFLNGICPPATLNIKAVLDDGKRSNFCTVENSCFHICHKAAVSKAVATTMSRSPLASIGGENITDSPSPLQLVR